MKDFPEFAEEYTKHEKFKFIAIGFIAGSFLVLFAKFVIVPTFNEFVLYLLCRDIFGFKGTTVLWFLVFAGLPVFFGILVGAPLGFQGYRILRDRQFPPIGQKVTKPTRINRGKQVKWIGWMHFFPSGLFLAIAIWGSFQASAMSKKTIDNRTHCESNVVSGKNKL